MHTNNTYHEIPAQQGLYEHWKTCSEWGPNVCQQFLLYKMQVADNKIEYPLVLFRMVESHPSCCNLEPNEYDLNIH